LQIGMQQKNMIIGACMLMADTHWLASFPSFIHMDQEWG